MRISCYCPTFRRPHLLEEALQSFLLQDYAGEKELVILNDEPEQTLRFDHPQVRILNVSKRITSLPEKYNIAAGKCSGQLLVPWDDDDIYLPHRLSAIATTASAGGWYTDDLLFDSDPDGATPVKGIVHCNHAWTPGLLIACGAYHDANGQASFDWILANQARSRIGPIRTKAAPSYIYRKHHGSRNHSRRETWNESDHDAAFVEGNPLVLRGEIFLRPQWTRDWMAYAEAAKGRPVKKINELDPCYAEQTED